MSYMWDHWEGCFCEDCEARFLDHNRKFRASGGIVTCGCTGCQRRWYHKQLSQSRAVTENIVGLEEGRGMGSINVCEREGCETFMKGSAVGAIQIAFNRKGTPESVRTLELCPGCIEDVWRVLSSGPMSTRERSYSKPYSPDVADIEDELNKVNDEQLAAALFQRMMTRARKEITNGDSE